MIPGSLLVLASLTAVSAPAAALPVSSPAAVAEWNNCGYQPTTNVKLRTGPTKRHTAIGILTPKDSVYVLRETASTKSSFTATRGCVRNQV
ncbi:hypothetical protein GCM10020367_68930 [Streptomyces sannanensis]|uniref:SH3 domain-containing protein n=1 Tax=Streptomyces sannanensis TaxID=285536 RepID=A0ABP6SN80_9ACTN